MHFEDKKQCMPLDIDKVDRRGISCDSSFAENKEKKTLVYVKSGSEKIISKIFFNLACYINYRKFINDICVIVYYLYLCFIYR